MAEVLSPAPVREAVTWRDSLLLTPTWVRWLELLRQQAQAGGGGGDGTVPVSGITPVTSPRLIGRYSTGSGPAQEITPGPGLTLDTSGVLSAAGVPGPPGPTGPTGPAGATGATTFQALTDAADYSAGVAGQFVRVNAGGTGLEYVAGGATFTAEDAQDAVGTILVDTATIDLTYNDATPSITAAVVAGSIGTTQLGNDQVTYAKLQNVTDARLLGRSAGSAGDAQELTVAGQLTLSGGVLTGTGQPLDATLTALAGLATGANQLAYSTGTDTFAQTPLTAAGRALLDDADNTTQRTTLGLGTAATQAYTEGTFTITGTGFSTAATATARYAKMGNQVTLYIPFVGGTSNATTFTLTGLPGAVQPTRLAYVPVRVQDNGAVLAGLLVMDPGTPGALTVYSALTGAGWTASGVKSLGDAWYAYALL